MSSKTVAFKNPTLLTKPAEDWVGAPGEGSAPKPVKHVGPTKRLTVDIPEDLHRRIKVSCAMNDKQITDVVHDILAKEFPPV